MTPSEYIKQAKQTDVPDYKKLSERLDLFPHLAILHAMLGMVTEVGEFTDAIKKHLLYGKELDLVNLDEEIGDLLWYIAIYIESRQGSFESIMQINIEKLRARYPNKFTEYDALNRNLDNERNILEGK